MTPGYDQAAAPASVQKVRRPGLIIGLIAGLLILILLLAAGAYWFFGLGGIPLFGGKYLAIGTPQEEAKANLYLVEEGQSTDDGVLLAEKIESADAYFLVRDANHPDFQLSKAGYNYSGFVPRSKNILVWYQYDGKILLDQISTGNDEPDAILDATSEALAGAVVNSGKKVILIETLTDETRCYVSESGTPADLLGKGSGCAISGDGSMILLIDTKDGKSTITAITADENKDETEIVDEQEGIIAALISWDGSRAAYVQTENDKARVVLVDTENGDELSKGEDSPEIVKMAFAPRSTALFYIADLGDGSYRLNLLDDEETNEVASSKNLTAWFSRDGKYLIYLEGDETSNLTLNSYNIKADEQEKVISGANLAYSVLDFPERVLTMEKDGTQATITSAKVDGLDSITLYKENDRELIDVWTLPGENELYLLLKNSDALQSLYVTPMDKEEGYFLIQDWAEVKLLNRSPNGKEAVIVGRKEASDPLTLFSIALEDGADPVELDDNLEGVSNASYSADNKSIYYTAKIGPNPEDVEVRKVDAKGEDAPDVEYEKAFLVDTQWTPIEPFISISWLSIGEAVTTEEPVEEEVGVSECAKTVDLVLGTDLQDNIGVDQKNCYRLETNPGQAYSIILESLSDLDLTMTIKDASGVELASDDDSGSGANPLINIKPAAGGLLTIEVVEKNNKAGDFRIRAQEGTTDTAQNAVQPILPGVREHGVITEASVVTIPQINYSTHGVMYSYQGTTGQQITIDVFANSLGSELVPYLIFYDANYNVIQPDNVIVAGNQDYTFLFTLPVDGQYFILVKDSTDRYGSAEKFFFEIFVRP